MQLVTLRGASQPNPNIDGVGDLWAPCLTDQLLEADSRWRREAFSSEGVRFPYSGGRPHTYTLWRGSRGWDTTGSWRGKIGGRYDHISLYTCMETSKRKNSIKERKETKLKTRYTGTPSACSSSTIRVTLCDPPGVPLGNLAVVRAPASAHLGSSY